MTMPTSTQPLQIRRRLGRSNWSTPVPFGPDGWRFESLDGDGVVIVSCAPCGPDDSDWVHASMSRRGRVPDYDDLKALHVAVFDGGWAYQVFAPPSDHVNIHEHVLHLFGRLDGQPQLPDFTYGMRSI